MDYRKLVLTLGALSLVTVVGGCSKETVESSKQTVKEATESVKEAASEVADSAGEAMEATKEATSDAVHSAGEMADDAADSMHDMAAKTGEAVSDAADATSDTAKEAWGATKDAASDAAGRDGPNGAHQTPGESLGAKIITERTLRMTARMALTRAGNIARLNQRQPPSRRTTPRRCTATIATTHSSTEVT